jgi:hypothetical protein
MGQPEGGVALELVLEEQNQVGVIEITNDSREDSEIKIVDHRDTGVGASMLLMSLI